MTDILHTANVLGRPVRFIRSPAAEPDLPHHVVQDLHAALRLPRALRRQLLAALERASYGSDASRVMLDGRALLAAPHYQAQGLIGGAIEAGGAPARALEDYTAAITSAFEREADLLALSAEQTSSRLLQAVTGRTDHGVRARINVETGERVYSGTELQRALGMSDEDFAAAAAEAEARGFTRSVADSKLATVQ